MAEYIDREKVLALGYWHGEHPDFDNPNPDGVDAVDVSNIEAMPAADVAEVVRCKDCAKHYIVLGRDMCARNAQGSEGHWIGLSATVPDGFCHRGVHK